LYAIECAAEENARQAQKLSDDRKQQNYMLFWDNLKQKFVHTRWFSKVDEILLQNTVVKAVTQQLRPAEVFFNTATEVFLTDGATFEQFLAAMKDRMGPAWDNRLAAPAKAFHATSSAVQGLVGAGRFFGGAVQLGRQKLNSAIDDLLHRWDRVLDVTDDAVDSWLPERGDGSTEAITASSPQSAGSNPLLSAATPADMDADTSGSSVAADTSSDGGSEDEMAVAAEYSRRCSKKRDRSVMPLARKISKRLRERLPLLTELPQTLRDKLGNSQWFHTVDEILRENSIVQMMQLQMMAAMSQVVRPAEHFYNTAVQTFSSHARSCEAFVANLRITMGSAWDERLTQPAVQFFHVAQELAGLKQQDACASQPAAAPSQ